MSLKISLGLLSLAALAGIATGRFCSYTDIFGNYKSKYCSGSCCGSSSYRYCCSSSTSTTFSSAYTGLATVWIVVISIACIVVVATIVGIILCCVCCCKSSPGARGVVVQHAQPNHMVAMTTTGQTNMAYAPGPGYPPAAYPGAAPPTAYPGAYPPAPQGNMYPQGPPPYNPTEEKVAQ